MGDIVRRGTKDRPRFYLRYLDADGQRKQRAAKGALNVGDARRMLAEVERRIMGGKIGIEEPTPEEQGRRTITVAQLAEKFLAEQDGYRNPKIKDMRKYRKQARSNLKRVLPTLGRMPAAQVTPVQLERLRDDLMAAGEDGEAGYAARSVHLAFAVLSKMYTWGRRVGLVECGNPKSNVDMPPTQSSIDFLSKLEVAKLLEHVEREAPDLLPMVATALYTGMRKGELFGLRWTDVQLDAGRIDVNRSYRTLPKSGKVRHLPINAELAPILRMWRNSCFRKSAENLVFPVNGRMGNEWDMLALAELLEAADCHVPAMPWHSMRHTFASHFIMAGGNILTLQKLLGHSTVQMTMRYAHLAPDFMATEVARMSFRAVGTVTRIDDARAVG
jgi:integrase